MSHVDSGARGAPLLAERGKPCVTPGMRRICVHTGGGGSATGAIQREAKRRLEHTPSREFHMTQAHTLGPFQYESVVLPV